MPSGYSSSENRSATLSPTGRPCRITCGRALSIALFGQHFDFISLRWPSNKMFIIDWLPSRREDFHHFHGLRWRLVVPAAFSALLSHSGSQIKMLLNTKAEGKSLLSVSPDKNARLPIKRMARESKMMESRARGNICKGSTVRENVGVNTSGRSLRNHSTTRTAACPVILSCF